MLQRLLHGDDIFISYSRGDGGAYAAGLADELTAKKFSCFIDKLGTEPNQELPPSLKRKIRGCTLMVLVGTERGAASRFVGEEIAEFRKTRRTIVPIDFGGAVGKATWYGLIPGLAAEPEDNPDALRLGDPSENVISRIEKSFNYTRRNNRLGRLAAGAALLLALLLASAVVAGAYATRKVAEAQDALGRAQRAQRQADESKKQADEFNAQATAARAEAEREKQRAADATDLAERQGESARRSAAEAKKQQAVALREAAEAKKQGEIARTKAEEARVETEEARRASEEAQRQTERARREQTKADSQNVASNARSLLGYDPEQSVLLAAHAVKLLGDAGLERPPLTEDVLRRALASSSVRAILTPDNTPPPYSEQAVPTRGVAFSRDGRFAVTSSVKGADVWDTKTGGRLAHSSSVYGSDFSFTSDGSAVVWGGGQQVNVWDWSKGGDDSRKLEAPDSPAADIYIAHFSDDGKVLAMDAEKQFAQVRDVDTGRVLAEFRHDYKLSQVGFSPGGRFVCTVAASAEGSPGHLIQVWGADGRRLWAFRAGGENDGVKLSPTGRRVVIYNREVVELWDAVEGKRVETLDKSGTHLRVVKFSPDGRLLAVGGDADAALVWDAETGKELAVLSGHSTVWGLDFSPDGNLLVTASDNGAARVWHTGTWQPVLELHGHSGPVTEVAFSPDGGRLLLTLSEDGSGRLWDASPGRRPVTELKPESLLYGLGGRYLKWVGFSPDGRSLLTSGAGVEVWDTATGLRASQQPAESLHDIAAYSNDWRLYLSAREGWEAPRVIEAKTGREVSKLSLEYVPTSGAVSDAVFDPEGKVVVTLGGSRAFVWDVATGQRIKIITGSRLEGQRYPNVNDAAFSRDGRLFAYATGGKVGVLDAREWKQVREFPEGGSKLKYFGVAFSPDGRALAAAGLGVTVWDVTTGEKLAHLSPDRTVQTTNDVAFSPDGRLVAAANSDGTTQVWEWKTGRRVNLLNDGPRATRRVGFSPDGRLLMTTNDDGLVRLYPEEMFLPFESLGAFVPRRVGRSELTEYERKRYLPAEETPKPAPTP